MPVRSHIKSHGGKEYSRERPHKPTLLDKVKNVVTGKEKSARRELAEKLAESEPAPTHHKNPTLQNRQVVREKAEKRYNTRYPKESEPEEDVENIAEPAPSNKMAPRKRMHQPTLQEEFVGGIKEGIKLAKQGAAGVAKLGEEQAGEQSKRHKTDEDYVLSLGHKSSEDTGKNKNVRINTSTGYIEIRDQNGNWVATKTKGKIKIPETFKQGGIEYEVGDEDEDEDESESSSSGRSSGLSGLLGGSRHGKRETTSVSLARGTRGAGSSNQFGAGSYYLSAGQGYKGWNDEEEAERQEKFAQRSAPYSAGSAYFTAGAYGRKTSAPASDISGFGGGISTLSSGAFKFGYPKTTQMPSVYNPNAPITREVPSMEPMAQPTTPQQRPTQPVSYAQRLPEHEEEMEEMPMEQMGGRRRMSREERRMMRQQRKAQEYQQYQQPNQRPQQQMMSEETMMEEEPQMQQPAPQQFQQPAPQPVPQQAPVIKPAIDTVFAGTGAYSSGLYPIRGQREIISPDSLTGNKVPKKSISAFQELFGGRM